MYLGAPCTPLMMRNARQGETVHCAWGPGMPGGEASASTGDRGAFAELQGPAVQGPCTTGGQASTSLGGQGGKP